MRLPIGAHSLKNSLVILKDGRPDEAFSATSLFVTNEGSTFWNNLFLLAAFEIE